MESFFVLIGLLFLIAPILGLVAFFQVQGAKTRLAQQEMVARHWEGVAGRLDARLTKLEERGVSNLDRTIDEAVTIEEDIPAPSVPLSSTGASTFTDDADTSLPDTDDREQEDHGDEQAEEFDGESDQEPEASPVAAKEQVEPEARFVAKWAIWFGAASMALAGAFLVKYSVDAGFLGPAQRIGAAILFGLLTMAAGEWVRRGPRQIKFFVLDDERIPPALTAAGLFMTFAAIFGGYSLYDLFPAVVAFGALAATSVGGGMLSILHGRYGSFVAGLGMLGAYAVPLLVQTETPSSVALFTYVGALNVATLSLLRWRGWTWLGWGVLIGASLWPLLFLSGMKVESIDYLVMELYGFLSAFAVALVMGTGHGDGTLATENIKDWTDQGVLPALNVGYLAAIAASVLLFVVVQDANYVPYTVWIAAIAAAGFAALAARIWTLFPLALVSTGLVAAVLLAWPSGNFTGVIEGVAPILPGGSQFFLTIACVSAIVAFCIGSIKLWESRPGYWSSVATIVPMGLFVVAYLKLLPVEHSFLWNWAAFGLFILYDVLARWVWQRFDGPRREIALAAMIIAITGAMSLALTLTFDQAWLTVSLSLQVPVLAWLYLRMKLPILRLLAGLIAAAVLVRLVGNPYLTSYPLKDISPVINWMWYGYGLPALAFGLAARWFEQGATSRIVKQEHWSVAVMQAASLVMFVLLVTLQIRAFMEPEVFKWGTFSLMESSLDVIAWLTIALGLYWRYPTRRPLVMGWARRALIIYSGVQILFVHLLTRNPMLENVSVGNLPVLNLLALAFLAPAILAVGFTIVSLSRERQNRILPVGLTAGVACLLTFVYVSFEVRHLFHGSNLNSSISENALQIELYTYSAAWLAIAGVLIWAGLMWAHRILRLAGMGLLAIVVAKVFLVDMSELTGLFRVLSFGVLGICMIVVGQAYQRFVVRSEPASPAEPESNGQA